MNLSLASLQSRGHATRQSLRQSISARHQAGPVGCTCPSGGILSGEPAAVEYLLSPPRAGEASAPEIAPCPGSWDTEPDMQPDFATRSRHTYRLSRLDRPSEWPPHLP